MPDAPPRDWLPDRDFSPEFLRLRGLVLDWIAPYYDREHLQRAADWALALEPGADEPSIIAVLAHDMERAVPGGPKLDKRTTAWDDETYNRRHCERSAAVVAGWLTAHGAQEPFVSGVQVPILEHEFGGSPAGDLAQAADSLSWLDVNARLASRWVQRGECDGEKAHAKLRFMAARIRRDDARALAEPMYERAAAELDERLAQLRAV